MKILQHQGFSMIEFLLVLVILANLAAISIPEFIRYSGRSKRIEATAILLTLHKAEISYFATQEVWAINAIQVPGKLKVPKNLEISIEQPIYYQSVFYKDLTTFGGGIAPGHYGIGIYGNIDSDEVLDGWFISSATLSTIPNQTAGVPALVADDLGNSIFWGP